MYLDQWYSGKDENGLDQLDGLDRAAIDIALQDSILPALRGAVDNNSRKLLASAEYGWDSLLTDVVSGEYPAPEELPCVRVFCDLEDYEIPAIETYMQEGLVDVYILFLYYCRTDIPFQLIRNAHIRACLKSLFHPAFSAPNPGIAPTMERWKIPSKNHPGNTNWKISHNNVMQLIGGTKELDWSKGYFASMVNIKIDPRYFGQND